MEPLLKNYVRIIEREKMETSFKILAVILSIIKFPLFECLENLRNYEPFWEILLPVIFLISFYSI